MEHEVFVPVPVASLRRTLSDPARVARCVPGLQQDADGSAGPLTGRLKIRVGGHTITYRGVLQVSDQGGDAFSVTGDGVEARGSGSAELALTIVLAETDGGTMLEFTGTASGAGRIVELGEEAALAAFRRLVDRFTQQLVTESLTGHEAADGPPQQAQPTDEGHAQAREQQPESVPDESAPDESVSDDDSAPAPDAPAPESAASSGEASPGEASSDDPSSGQEPPDEGSMVDPVPPPSLDPTADMEFVVPDEPPAEAAHARRTMIGRSTEEVDHAPPRGRYAPEPSQDVLTAGSTLRWAAPAAALVIASAVVVGRALRRRR